MPCLWKVKSSDYCNRELKNKCYNNLIEKLKQIDPDANREKVVKKINVFRTNYKRDLKKVKKSEKSGAGADSVFESSLWYFEKLKFLEDQECSREGICTMDNESVNVICENFIIYFLYCIILFFYKQTESADETFVTPSSKKRNVTAEDNLLKIACQKLTDGDDATSVLAKGWATQYEELSKAQKIFARTIFSDVLFHGCLDKLTEKTVEDIHRVLQGVLVQRNTPYLSRTSTPYFDEYTPSPQSYTSLSQHVELPLLSPPPTQTQRFCTPTVQNNLPVITNQEVLATETIQPTQPSIVQFISNFVDE